MRDCTPQVQGQGIKSHDILILGYFVPMRKKHTAGRDYFCTDISTSVYSQFCLEAFVIRDSVQKNMENI